MMFGLFRAGRMIARTGGAAPKARSAPQPVNVKAASLFWLIVVTATCGYWWRPMFAVAGAILLLGLGVLADGGQPKRRPAVDPLTKAMREYGKGGRP